MRTLIVSLFLLLSFGIPIGASAQYTDVIAESGDGIWSILRRNGVPPTTATVAQFKELNRSVLRGGNALHRGRKYRIPSQGKRYPIFGERYALVEPVSDRLNGHVYYIVAGHGGPDPGTRGTFRGRSIAEDEIAYDTALRVSRRLLEHGATVYHIVQDPDDGIRDTDVLPLDTDEHYIGGGPIARSHKERLETRIALINGFYDKHRKTAKSQQVVSLHVDATSSRNAPRIDVHFFSASAKGRRLSTRLQETVRAQYAAHQPDRGYRGRVATRELDILMDTKPVAVLIELGNIKNTSDQIRLTRPGNRQALADWIVEGLIADVASIRL